jgi:hypothetical protein
MNHDRYRELRAILSGELYRESDLKLAEIIENLNIQQSKSIQRAIAQNHSKTTLYGRVAIAESKNFSSLPIIVDIAPLDIPNNNKQGIKSTEKNNILTTALHRSITANFNGSELLGHQNSVAVGTITDVFEEQNIIKAHGYIWADQHQELAEFLRAKKSVGSSWELYYAHSTVDTSGIEWLESITFSSQTLVSRPSYGDLTPARLL